MHEMPEVRGIVPYVFCEDAGAVADWCVRVLSFDERGRWSEGGHVRNVELVAGQSEVWLDGGVNWKERFAELGSWVGFWVDDVDAVYEHLRARTTDVTPPVEREFGIRTVTATDPEGHQWGFMRRTS